MGGWQQCPFGRSDMDTEHSPRDGFWRHTGQGGRVSAGSRSELPLRCANDFCSMGADAVKCLEENTEVRMRAFPYHPDYLSELPGSSTWGRVLECLPFDGRQLVSPSRWCGPHSRVHGARRNDGDRIDIDHLLNVTRAWTSFAHSARLLLRHAADRVRYPRGTRMVMGNALWGRAVVAQARRPDLDRGAH